MQQRILRHRLIAILIGLMAVMPIGAKELTEQQIEATLIDPIVVEATFTYAPLFEQQAFVELDAQLASLTLLEREAVLYQLVDWAAGQPQLSYRQLDWLSTLSAQLPVFTVREQRDGYVVSTRAFNYSLLAQGVVREHEQRADAKAVMKQLEQGQLGLASWLKVPLVDYYTRRDMLLEHLDEFSDEGIEILVSAFGPQANELLWLPDNAVIAALATRTGNEALYHLLWRRRTDAYTVEALQAVAEQAPKRAALTQLMAATSNPSIKSSAYQYLARLQPMPMPVQQFLVAKLDEVEDGQLVASQLVTQGYQDWLSELADSEGSTIRTRHIHQVLAEFAP